MRCLILPAIILVIGFHKINGEAVWNFGNDVRGSVLLEQKTGHINLLTKHTQVQLAAVDPCMKVVLVRVKVDNIWTTPEVTYDESTMTVDIMYKFFQITASDYDVAVKGILKHGCKTNVVQNIWGYLGQNG